MTLHPLFIALPPLLLAAAACSGGSSAAPGDGASPQQVEVGRPAPDFALPSSTGGTVRLSELKGKTVVLYFYPKDATPG